MRAHIITTFIGSFGVDDDNKVISYRPFPRDIEKIAEKLKLSEIENQPRWDAIKWYCDTIGINFENTIKRINQIKKLF